jgi:hypothetical protein
MSDSGFGVGDLSGIADVVGTGADDLGGLSAPDAPDAGASSAAVAGALGSVSSVIAKVVGTAASARGLVAANHRSYRDTDESWQAAFAASDERMAR